MSKLGTRAKPAIVRVKTEKRAAEIMSICNEHGWVCIVGIEPDKREDISDVERLLNPAHADADVKTPNRNAPCPCGSGKKYKYCHGATPKKGAVKQMPEEKGSAVQRAVNSVLKRFRFGRDR